MNLWYIYVPFRGNVRWFDMAAERQQLARAWQLRDSEGAALARLDGVHWAACLDVDRALTSLLGDRDIICLWLRNRQPALFHTRPLDLLLGSRSAAQQVRALLLGELSGMEPSNGLVAAALLASP